MAAEEAEEGQNTYPTYDCFQTSMRWDLGRVSRIQDGATPKTYEIALKTSSVRLKLLLTVNRQGNIGFHVSNLSKEELHIQYAFSLVTGAGERIVYKKPLWLVYEAAGSPNDTRGTDELSPFATLQKIPGDVEMTIYCDFKLLRESGDGCEELSNPSQPLHDCPKAPEKEVTSSLISMLEEKKNTDFKIICGKEVIPCHRLIIASRSKILETLSSKKGKAEIKLEDCNPETAKEFLHFLYTNKVSSGDCETLMSLLPLAKKFEIPALRHQCSEKLVSGLDIENVTAVSKAAFVHKLDRLRYRSVNYIVDNAEKVSQTKGWHDLTETCPDIMNHIIALLSARVGGGTDNYVPSKQIIDIPRAPTTQGVPATQAETSTQNRVSSANEAAPAQNQAGAAASTGAVQQAEGNEATAQVQPEVAQQAAGNEAPPQAQTAGNEAIVQAQAGVVQQAEPAQVQAPAGSG